jgi:hypothetical protein
MTVGRIPSVEGGIQPTIVDAKGDLIAAVAADSLNRLAVGSNDQVLVADSAASTGLAWKSYGAQVVAGKNAVINGGFDIWQRGTSISLSATGTVLYSADRWCNTLSANQATTISRQATGDTTNLPNIQYCLRFQRNSGQTGVAGIPFGSNLETAQSVPMAGKTVTMSFYARKGANYSATSSILQSYIITGTGTDQNTIGSSYTGINTSINQNNTLTTTWQRFSITGTLPTNTSEICAYFAFTPTGTAGADDYFEITGVQLELGSTATTFSRSMGTIQGELAACQRYYWQTSPYSASAYSFLTPFSGIASSTTLIYFAPILPVTMRALVSVSYSGLRAVDGTAALTTISAIAFSSLEITSNPLLSVTLTGATQYRSYALSANNSLTSYLAISGEL